VFRGYLNRVKNSSLGFSSAMDPSLTKNTVTPPEFFSKFDLGGCKDILRDHDCFVRIPR